VITSPHNKRVAKAARLKKRAMREKDRAFLVEGAQGVVEALASGGAVREVFVSPGSHERLELVRDLARKAGVPVHAVSPELMAHLTSTVTPQGMVGVAGFVDVGLRELWPGSSCVPVLVEVRDPGNAGTILRSADASGADAVVFTRSSVDVYNPKTVRASAGSLFHVPVVRGVDVEEAVEELRGRGFAILAAATNGEQSLFTANLADPVAVLFGNEAWGLSGESRSLADAAIRIPISGRAESLNLAAAAALILFESARQRWGGAAGEGADTLARIVAGAAHDIRSPLTALKGFTSTLLSRWERLDDEQRHAMLEGIAGDAARMELVVAQLVDAARLRSGSLELAPVPTDLLAAARDTAEDSRSWSQGEILVGGEAVRAAVDPRRLRTMLAAMVETAQWFTEEGPIGIEVGDASGPMVSVWRRKPTVAAAEVDGLFVPRAPGSGGGSKVGLFVARGLAEAHGGTLTAAVDARLTLTLHLPAAAP